MRLVLVPPYENALINWAWILREAVDNMKKRGQIEGVEIDVDEGYFIESTSEKRDEQSSVLIGMGNLRKVIEYSEMGKHDAVILTGGADPSLAAARLVSKIPVVGAVFSTLHMASLIGDRCGMIKSTLSGSLGSRHLAERYGLSHKLASIRACEHTTTEMYGLLSKYKDDKAARAKDPGIKKIIDDTTTQCIAAIEKERVDTLLLITEPFLAFDDEVRKGVDEAGYDEIPIMCAVPAAVEMARAMVNMKLPKAPRAFPNQDLKAKPEYY